MASVKINLIKLKKSNLIEEGIKRGIHFKSTAKKQNLINGLLGKSTKYIKNQTPMKIDKINMKKLNKSNLIEEGIKRGIHFNSTAKKQNLINELLGKPSQYLIQPPNIKISKLKKQNLIKLGNQRDIFFPNYARKQNMINALTNDSPYFVQKPKVKKTNYQGTVLLRYLHLLFLTKKRNNVFHSINHNVTNAKFLETFNTRYLGYINIDFKPVINTFINNIHIDNFIESKKQFFIIPLFLNLISKKSAHLNTFIYNKKTKDLEYFEPHGLFYSNEFRKRKTICQLVKQDLKSKGLDIKRIIYINRYLFGPQHYNHAEFMHVCKGDPEGFCQVWSFWFIDYRVKHYEQAAVQLATKFTKELQKDKLSFKSFIRNYGEQITMFKNKYAPECPTDNIHIYTPICITQLRSLYTTILRK